MKRWLAFRLLSILLNNASISDRIRVATYAGMPFVKSLSWRKRIACHVIVRYIRLKY